MRGVFDQLSWQVYTDGTSILQLVSTQLDEQEELRQRIRDQLARDYPPDALAWISTVTWTAATLVPLTSFDLSDVKSWPTWKDTAKVKFFTERITSGWNKPIVSVKVPGSRHLDPIDGHTRLSVCWKLRRPVLSWIGKAHAVHGPWEEMHRRQRGMTKNQQTANFTAEPDQLIELGEPISDEAYQGLLSARRSARSAYPTGDLRRVSAERAVRKARKQRNLSRESVPEIPTVTRQLELVPHDVLLEERRKAQLQYPAGHPERIRAERAVRRSRSLSRCTEPEERNSVIHSLPKPAREFVEDLINANFG